MADVNGGFSRLDMGQKIAHFERVSESQGAEKEKGSEKDLSNLLPHAPEQVESHETLSSATPLLNKFMEDPSVRWSPSTDSSQLKHRMDKGKARADKAEPSISREAPFSAHRKANAKTDEVSKKIFVVGQETSAAKKPSGDELDRSKAFKVWRSVILHLPKSLAKKAISFSVKLGIVQIKDMDPSLIVRLSSRNIKEVPIPQLRKLSNEDLVKLNDAQIFAIGPYKLKELSSEKAAVVINHLDGEQANNFLIKFKEFYEKDKIGGDYVSKLYDKLEPNNKAYLGADILIEQVGLENASHEINKMTPYNAEILLKEFAVKINKAEINFESAAPFYKALNLDNKAVINFHLVGGGEPKGNLFLHKLKFLRFQELRNFGEVVVKGDTALLTDVFRKGAEASDRSEGKETLGDTGIKLLKQFKRDAISSSYTVNGARVDPDFKKPAEERWYPVLRDIYQSSRLDAKMTQSLQLILQQGTSKEMFEQAADHYGLLSGRQYALTPMIGVTNQTVDYDVNIDNKKKEVTIRISSSLVITDQTEDTPIGKAVGATIIKISKEDLREGRADRAEVSYSFSPVEETVGFREGYRTILGKQQGVESRIIEQMPHKERAYGGGSSFAEAYMRATIPTDRAAIQERRLEGLKTAFNAEHLTEAALESLNTWAEEYPGRVEYLGKKIENSDIKYADNPNPFEAEKAREEFKTGAFADIIQRCEQKMKDNPELTKKEAFDQLNAEITTKYNSLTTPKGPVFFDRFAHMARDGKGSNTTAFASDKVVVREFIEDLLAPYGDNLTTDDRRKVREDLGTQIVNSALTLAQNVTPLIKEWESDENQQKLQALKAELKQVILEAYKEGEVQPSAERLEQLKQKYANSEKGEIAEDVFNEVIEEALDRSKNLSSFFARSYFSVDTKERIKTDYYEDLGSAEDKIRDENRSRFADYSDNRSKVQERRFNKRFDEGVNALFDNALVELFDTPEPELPTDKKIPGINFLRQAQGYADFLLDETFMILDKNKTQ